MRRFLLPNPINVPQYSRLNTAWGRPLYTGGFSTPPQRFSRNIPQNDELFPVTKSIFQIIKSQHHLDSLLSGPPPSLKRKAASLQSQLHPAFIDDDFRTAVKRNADCWLFETVETLRRHYHGVIEKASRHLTENSVLPDRFEQCISNATNWARNQLGKKLNLNQLDATLTFVRSLPPQQQQPSVAEFDLESDFSVIQDSHQLTSTATQTEEILCTSASNRGPSTCDIDTSISETAALSQQAAVVSTPLPNTAPRSHVSNQEETPTVTTAPRKRQRHNSSSPGANLSQLDIFMTPLSQPRRRRTSSLPDTTTMTDAKEVIFGDSNLEQFQRPNTSVFAKQNGRLSHFKTQLSSITTPNQNVKKFVLCLSTLDASNTLTTNSTTLKSVVGAAHRVFPQAKLFVQLLGIDKRFPDTWKSNIEALNTFIINKHPSSCFHIPPDPDFTCTNHTWSDETKRRCFEKISQFLN